MLCIIGESLSTSVYAGDKKIKIDPSRQEKLVKKAMVAVFPTIAKAMEEVNAQSMYKQQEKVELKFYLSPTGKISFMGFVNTEKTDRKIEGLLKKPLHLPVMDTVDEVGTFTKIVIASRLGKDNAIILSDKMDIDYIEIRAQSDIIMVIDINRRDLIREYSRRWAQNKELQGTIYVKFAIDEQGNVIKATQVKSSLNDPVFEKTILKNVSRWKFGKIYNPGDITQIVYPFNFSQ